MALANKTNLSDAEKKFAKSQIIACVDTYKKIYARDYAIVVAQVKAERAKLKDAKFATTGMESTDVWANRYPADLEDSISQSLMGHRGDVSEASMARFNWFKSVEGNVWFSKRFPEFTLGQEV